MTRPAPAPEPAAPRMTRRVARLFTPYRGRLTAVLGLIVVSASLGMLSPFLLRDVLERHRRQPSTLWPRV